MRRLTSCKQCVANKPIAGNARSRRRSDRIAPTFSQLRNALLTHFSEHTDTKPVWNIGLNTRTNTASSQLTICTFRLFRKRIFSPLAFWQLGKRISCEICSNLLHFLRFPSFAVNFYHFNKRNQKIKKKPNKPIRSVSVCSLKQLTALTHVRCIFIRCLAAQRSYAQTRGFRLLCCVCSAQHSSPARPSRSLSLIYFMFHIVWNSTSYKPAMATHNNNEKEMHYRG